jgi:hypothetical protein
MSDWNVVTAATCETDGLQRKDCSRCDHFEEEVIPAGHKVENGICTGCKAYGTCGDNLIWTLENGVLTITGKGAMVDFSDVNVQNVPWNPVAKQVQKLVVEEGITTIGGWSFVQCTNISELSLPTTLKTIGAHAFYNNAALTEVTLPEGLDTIGNTAFSFCRQLKSIDIPATVKTVGDNAFSLCNNLETVVVGGVGTAIGGTAFGYNSKLCSVTLRSGETFPVSGAQAVPAFARTRNGNGSRQSYARTPTITQFPGRDLSMGTQDPVRQEVVR